MLLIDKNKFNYIKLDDKLTKALVDLLIRNGKNPTKFLICSETIENAKN